MKPFPQLARALACASTAFLCWGAAQGATFTENFDASLPHPQLAVSATAPGFGLSLANGRAFMGQAAGSGNGLISLSTQFLVDGDFTVTVDANRSGLGSAELGLGAVFGADKGFTGYSDVFFVAQTGINANIAAGTSQTSGVTGLSATDASFRIRRVGTTVLDEVDTGSGFITLHSRSDGVFAGPVRLELFLIQEFGSTAGNQASFDNWAIVADSISAVPEASTWALLALGLIVLGGVRRR